jgi:hypothetical protein
MLSIRSFKAFPEFGSFSQCIDFPNQILGLWGANTKLSIKKTKVKTDTKIKRRVILLI